MAEGPEGDGARDEAEVEVDDEDEDEDEDGDGGRKGGRGAAWTVRVALGWVGVVVSAGTVACLGAYGILAATMPWEADVLDPGSHCYASTSSSSSASSSSEEEEEEEEGAACSVA